MEEKEKSEKLKNSEAFKAIVESWASTLNWIQNRTPDIPTIGPAAGLLRNAPNISAELANAMEELNEFNKVLIQYYSRVSAAWIEATRRVMTKAPLDLSEDKNKEQLRRVWIDIFEEEFTNMFDSEDFATIFGKLLKHEVEFNIHVQKLVEVHSKNLGIPTRTEIESVYKEIERIKRKLKQISDAIEDLSGGKKKDIAKVL